MIAETKYRHKYLRKNRNNHESTLFKAKTETTKPTLISRMYTSSIKYQCGKCLPTTSLYE